jgi:hypothetical protein
MTKRLGVDRMISYSRRVRAVRVAALAEEGGRILLPGGGDRNDAFVHIAQSGSSELANVSSPLVRIGFGGTR